MGTAWQVEYVLDDKPMELIYWENIELMDVLAVVGWIIDKYEDKNTLRMWN